MRKRTIILCCILALFLFLLGASGFLIKQKHDFCQTIAVLPDFCLPQAVDSTLFCSTQIAKDKPVLLMYMHPECDHCHRNAQQIQQKALNASDIQWVLVSYAAKDSLIKFMETYRLIDIQGLVVLMDSQLSLYDRLHVEYIPTSYIYNSRHRLVTVKRGAAIKLDKLIQLARQ